MHPTDYLRFLTALVFVLGLMGGFYLILKKLNLGTAPGFNSKRRLKIAEALMLDSRHRAVILQCDDKQHLVILSPSGETVVETGIKAPVSDDIHIHDKTVT